MKPILVNMHGVAGAGKSICAMHLVNLLKTNGINAEYCREVVKESTLFGVKPSSLRQIDITSKQMHLVEAYLRSGADVVVTDSPLLLGRMYGIHYGAWNEILEEIVQSHIRSDKFDTMNFLVQLGSEEQFQNFGREQTYEQSRGMESSLVFMMNQLLNYTTIDVKNFMHPDFGRIIVNKFKRLLEERSE